MSPHADLPDKPPSPTHESPDDPDTRTPADQGHRPTTAECAPSTQAAPSAAWRREALAAVISELDVALSSWTVHALWVDAEEQLYAQAEPDDVPLMLEAPLTSLLGRAQEAGLQDDAASPADLVGYALVHQAPSPHDTVTTVWAADLSGRMWQGHRDADGVVHAAEPSASRRDPYLRAVAALALATAGHFPADPQRVRTGAAAFVLLLGGSPATVANATAFAAATGLQFRHYSPDAPPMPTDWMDAIVALVDLDAVPLAVTLPLRPVTVLLVPAAIDGTPSNPPVRAAAESLLAEFSISDADQPDTPNWTTLAKLLRTKPSARPT
ncbi:hypothetical protein [Cryptosporangium phraense]|uniref:Uncharacterized protein n=1 Tax=Cryptosporangium phraense TaxID=2593070 RepID=A0A545ANB8_9ACTN|nr:hypothetical protein [Cryptosporangium phraense]TQS42828.1 hypothetical protein FL583_22515 [Cryptosporangium phraense]